MRLTGLQLTAIVLVVLFIGFFFGKRRTTINITKEGFQNGDFKLGAPPGICPNCGGKSPCARCYPLGPAGGAGMGPGGSGMIPGMSSGSSGMIPGMGPGGSGPIPIGFGSSGTNSAMPSCPPCRQPDMSKYVLKSSVPACPMMPDMSQYMLKTECPPTPDLSKYVLKSSIPKQGPIIIDNSACKKDCGECPPCPRPRCPEIKCPPATKCPPPAPCPRPVCPPQVVKCRAEQDLGDSVRPFLAPLGMPGFGEN